MQEPYLKAMFLSFKTHLSNEMVRNRHRICERLILNVRGIEEEGAQMILPPCPDPPAFYIRRT